MTRLTSDLSAGDTGRIEQYNDMRTEAKASSYLLAFEQATPDLTLKVSPGQIYFGSTLVEYAGGNSPSFTAPTTNPRIDILSINDSGTLVRTAGTEGATPTAPDVPAGEIPIAQVYNRVGQTSIKDSDDSTNGYIGKDLRPFVGISGVPIVRLYTSSNTWTKPTGLNYIEVEAVGGGAGGDDQGGGGGGYFKKLIAASALASTVSVTVGAGVSAGVSGNNTTFGSHATANGGNTNGTGGGASGGDINIQGQDGQMKLYDSPGGADGENLQGAGGDSMLGFGGVDSNANGQSYGGGGASSKYDTTAGGGAAGVVIVKEYY